MSYIRPSKVWAHLDRLLAWQRGGTAAPVTVEWDLSNRCVLGCQDCHFAHTHVKGPWASRRRTLPMAYDSTGDLADMGVLERAIAEMAREGVQGVIWSGGGEPTTHPAWRDAVLLASERGLRQGMYTLGGLLNADDGRLLGDHASWVVVSLDAADADTYASDKGVSPQRFRAACDGIVHLAGRQAVLGVSFLLHAGNWRQIEPMRRLARDLGAHYVTFRPAIQTRQDAPGQPLGSRDWVTEAWSTLTHVSHDPFVECNPERFAQYRDWTDHGYDACHGIKVSTVITPDGRLWVCPQRRGVAGSQIGDLRHESFASAWARHPGAFAVDVGCRAMCRLHLMNQELAPVFARGAHEAFV